jgi:hypothetical protein
MLDTFTENIKRKLLLYGVIFDDLTAVAKELFSGIGCHMVQ